MNRVGRALRDGLSSLRDRAAARLAALRFNPSRGEVPCDLDVDEAVSAWHHGAGGDRQELHDYLGWTVEEYKAWVSDPDAIPQRPLACD